jgi:hypothetical protein
MNYYAEPWRVEFAMIEKPFYRGGHALVSFRSPPADRPPPSRSSSAAPLPAPSTPPASGA